MAARTCWNCEQISHQTHVTSEASRSRDGRWFLPMTCDACGVMSVAAKEIAASGPTDARNILIASQSAEWYPQHMYGRRFEHVPHPVDAAASEAWACYSINQYRASVLMARAVVEATAKQQGFTKGRLVDKIDSLYDAETIGKGVKETAHEIRYIGNDMAHGDFVTDISEEECADVLMFLEQLLDEVYQRPARLSAFREKRLARNTET